ncbi:hypothetical protein FIBSPDRAFT_874621 [Athelia psychrophila]|uniref:Uncharacterized protein n=1 Tax=Athelia psychrophila TaxID=1759441 RepID=A0A165X9U3_9AGAM|nr:hypothetical protein FIBSPDRAFT_874621 [Fibularhizoctonia sp. CBS 109695]
MASWTIAALTLVSLLAVEPVQSTNISCLPDYVWMENSLGQNPCTMATIAQDACGGTWNILPFPPPAQAAGYYYPGSTDASKSTCMCSTVTYSLFSACGICQNGSFATWPQWTTNCTGIALSLSTFPDPIPANTTFPAWAYLNATGGFNVAAAQADDRAPESSPIPQSTAAPSTSASASSASSTSSAPSSSPSAAGNSSTHKSNTGAIAGGVIGGLAFVAALAALAVYLLRRRSQTHTAPSDTYYGAVPQNAPPMSQHTHTLSQPQPMYKPYDPSDPSTFPESAPTPTVQTTSSGLQSAEQPGAYRGVPEV